MRHGRYGVYVEKAYVLGEAPDVLRTAVGQRSRWCKVLVVLAGKGEVHWLQKYWVSGVLGRGAPAVLRAAIGLRPSRWSR